ncbi:MAG: flavin reductase family protein [Acidimicrobiales bacterium]
MKADDVVGPVPAGRDPDAYDRLRRRLLWALPSGLYVLGSRHEDRRNLMTISWVTQVATDPKLLAAGVETGSVTAGLVRAGGSFALTVLPRHERAVVRKFAKPVLDVDVDDAGTGTMHGEPVVAVPSGAPVLAAAAAWFDCRVAGAHDLGSHVLFLGEVTDCGSGAPGAAAGAARVEGVEGVELGEVLRMEDTRMNYGG